ncbi:hypothetical protein SC499_09100 [Peribacillus simplex]|uniref:hypothetical protein n=1 Tax=Peribacillus simplex TaxID=1478 RepID=UPI00298E0955|nr:hypothetical protein [Peribacillus simplex]MDW7614884.1 hypothetical protein [Peribacillus simplex]
MGISTLQEVSKLKANLLELADVLLMDKVLSREEIAFTLLSNIQSLNVFESDLHQTFCRTDFRKLHEMCEAIEDAREQKRASIRD